MPEQNVDPANYMSYPDEEHTVRCEWWFKDRKYVGWFRPEDIEPVQEESSANSSGG